MFERIRFNVNGINNIWAADLFDMQAHSKDNRGIKYLLTVIDVFSKFISIIPISKNLGRKLQKHFQKSLTIVEKVNSG